MAEDLTQRKRTMIKNRVGCAKTSTYNLPPGDHVYGFKQPTDLEGAGACEFGHLFLAFIDLIAHNLLHFELQIQ